MRLRHIAIVVCLALAGSPASADVAASSKPASAKPVPTKPVPNKPVPQVARKTARKPAAGKPAAQKPPAATVKAYDAMPLAERLAIQADLALTNYYDGPPGGDFDDVRTVDAVKAFQKGGNGKETGVLSADERARLADAAQRHEEEVGWRVIDDAQTGARFGLPERLVSPVGVLRTGNGWSSGHGQIRIETFRLSEGGLASLFDQEKKTPRGRGVDYSRLNADSFVITGTQGLKNFAVRVESRGAELRGITVLYDQATEGIMAGVAVAVANSFEGFPDPNAGLPAGEDPAVEYGTAIVVDRSGHLVAAQRLTARCEALMVPGFGHAVRIADDATSGLALLRLYGARQLVPAVLAGDSQVDDLTLAGIADPRVQAGGDKVVKVTARLDGQSVTPVPPLGFSGAAAVDAQGRFAGMVELKSAAAAAAGSAAGWRADLVPADTVRAFLTAHRVAPEPGGGAIEQSVVRVICVRK
jgi:hypothetical protein